MKKSRSTKGADQTVVPLSDPLDEVVVASSTDRSATAIAKHLASSLPPTAPIGVLEQPAHQ